MPRRLPCRLRRIGAQRGGVLPGAGKAGRVEARCEGPFVYHRLDAPAIASRCLLACGHLRAADVASVGR